MELLIYGFFCLAIFGIGTKAGQKIGNDLAKSNGWAPIRKIKYQTAVAGLIAFSTRFALQQGWIPFDVPQEVQAWATEIVVAIILLVGYLTNNKKGEVLG